ncbi:hypothetical protein CRENBAI_002825 [Crenichthys baileyi]|uniref:Uncharacterized protein n=1 Tax=Crenichthys baileyi TaxID=28760 RepID=A0AAV9RNT0_9TELE
MSSWRASHSPANVGLPLRTWPKHQHKQHPTKTGIPLPGPSPWCHQRSPAYLHTPSHHQTGIDAMVEARGPHPARKHSPPSVVFSHHHPNPKALIVSSVLKMRFRAGPNIVGGALHGAPPMTTRPIVPLLSHQCSQQPSAIKARDAPEIPKDTTRVA